MATEKSPAYQRYPKDYLSDENVAAMSLEEEGAYNRLMDHCWLEGSIPTDIRTLAGMCKGIELDQMRAIWKVVRKCFRTKLNHPSRMVHPRLEEEREKQAEWTRKSRMGGIKSGVKRAEKAKRQKKSNHPSKMVRTICEPNGNTASASSLKEKEKEKEKPAHAEQAEPTPIGSIMRIIQQQPAVNE